MKIPSLLITLTIAGTLAAASPQLHAQTPAQDAAAKALFREGRDFLDDGKYADAEKRFREALSKYPRAEQADRTSFYLIATLIKLGRTDEASAEVLSFNRKYPQSTWKTDVEEKRITLGLPAAPFGPVYRIHAIPQMPAPLQVPARYSTGLSVNTFMPTVSLEQEVFRNSILVNANIAITQARERLKANPSDPVIVSNFSTIAGSGSPQAFPFFVTIANDAPIPNTQTQARFWIGRLNNAEDSVGKAFIALTSDRSLPVFVEVLNQSNPGERNNVLRQVVQHPSLEKVVALEKVFNATTVQPFRSQIVESAATIPESAARDFITDVAKNEPEYTVRLSAIQALVARKDVDARVLTDIIRTLPLPAPAPPVSIRMKKDVRAKSGTEGN
jgi:hypothetical protein